MVIFSLKVIALITPPYLPLMFWSFLFEKLWPIQPDKRVKIPAEKFEEGSYLRRKIKIVNFQQFLSLLDHCVSLIDVEPVFCVQSNFKGGVS